MLYAQGNMVCMIVCVSLDVNCAKVALVFVGLGASTSSAISKRQRSSSGVLPHRSQRRGLHGTRTPVWMSARALFDMRARINVLAGVRVLNDSS